MVAIISFFIQLLKVSKYFSDVILEFFFLKFCHLGTNFLSTISLKKTCRPELGDLAQCYIMHCCWVRSIAGTKGTGVISLWRKA